MDQQKIRNDFDQIARLTVGDGNRGDRYDSFLLSLVPTQAQQVLDLGCGLGRLTARLLIGARQVTALDFSPEMIRFARQNLEMLWSSQYVSFVCADFLQHDFGEQTFDCIISVATLHHLPEHDAVNRMKRLLRPGGRLIIHDLRRDAGIMDWLKSAVGLVSDVPRRLLQSGRVRPSRAVREAWKQHGRNETYLTLSQARGLADRLLPGARVFNHWLWRYTLVWDFSQSH